MGRLGFLSRVPREVWAWVLMAVGAVLLLANAGEWIAQQRSGPPTAWPSVEGRIEQSSVREHRGRRGRRSYSPTVRYRYSVDGASYSGGHIYPAHEPRYDSFEAAESVLRAYPVGAAVRVYHASNDPARSALRTDEHGMGDAAMFTLLGLALLGGGFWFWRFVERRKAQAMVPGAPPQSGAAPPFA